MSFTLNDIIDNVKAVINYPQIRNEDIFVHSNNILGRIRTAYDWRDFHSIDESKTVSEGNNFVDISSITNIAQIQHLFLDEMIPENRVFFQEKNNFLSTIPDSDLDVSDSYPTKTSDLSGTPNYFNDEIKPGFIYFDVNLGEDKKVIILYKIVTPITDKDSVSKKRIDALDDIILLDDKFINVFEIGLIKSLLPLASAKTDNLILYNNLFEKQLNDLVKEESIEIDRQPKKSMKTFFRNTRTYRRNTLQNYNKRRGQW